MTDLERGAAIRRTPRTQRAHDHPSARAQAWTPHPLIPRLPAEALAQLTAAGFTLFLLFGFALLVLAWWSASLFDDHRLTPACAGIGGATMAIAAAGIGASHRRAWRTLLAAVGASAALGLVFMLVALLATLVGHRAAAPVQAEVEQLSLKDSLVNRCC